MTKTSVRITSFILAVIMLLSAILFTEFGTIKVEAAATSADCGFLGTAYASTTGLSAEQEYLIRVFPIPNALVDYYSKGAIFTGYMRGISNNGWAQKFNQTTGSTTTSIRLDKYRTLDTSVWIYTRNDDPQKLTRFNSSTSIMTDYNATEDEFIGYTGDQLSAKSLITASEIKSGSDAFITLFKGLDGTSIGDVLEGTSESVIASKLENKIKAYKKKNSNETGMLNAFKSYLSTSGQLTLGKLMDASKGSVTLCFEMYAAGSKTIGSTREMSFYSVSAIQDFAQKMGYTSGGAFSASDKFTTRDMTDNDISYSLFFAFPRAYTSLLPAYHTSSDWYTKKAAGNRAYENGTYYGGGGWCYYNFKYTGKPTPPPTSAFKITIKKNVLMSDGSTTPSALKTNINVLISPLVEATDFTTAKKTMYDELKRAAYTEASNKKNWTFSDVTSKLTHATGPAFSACVALTPTKQGYPKKYTTANQQIKITFDDIELDTNKSGKVIKTCRYFGIYESGVVTTGVGTWSACPVGIVQAVYSPSTKNWSFSLYSFTSAQSKDFGKTTTDFPQPKNAKSLGTLSMSDSTITVTNYYNISRKTVEAKYPTFTMVAQDNAAITYDSSAWSGSVLAGAKCTLYTRTTNLTSLEESSLGGLPSTHRLLPAQENTYTWNLSYFAKKLYTADYSHKDSKNLVRATTMTVNAPVMGTVYNREGSSKVNYEVTGAKSFTFNGLAALDTASVLKKNADTVTTFSLPYLSLSSASWKTGGTTVTLKKGTTYSLDTSEDTISSEAGARTALTSIATYTQQYAAYEALANRNFLELKNIGDYYFKQVEKLLHNLKLSNNASKYKAPLKTLTGYSITYSKDKGYTFTKDTRKSYKYKTIDTSEGYTSASTNEILDSYPSLKSCSTNSLIGEYFDMFYQYANDLQSIEANRPDIKITVTTNYKATDSNTNAKTPSVPAYYLSMTWTSPSAFSSKLRTMIYDFNATPVLESYGGQTSASYVVQKVFAAGNDTKLSYYRRYCNDTIPAISSNKTKSADTIAEALKKSFGVGVTLDDVNSKGSRFSVTYKGHLTGSEIAYSALDARLRVTDNFTTWSSLWQVQNGANATNTYLPSLEWAREWGVAQGTQNTGIAPDGVFSNKGTTSGSTSVTGSNMLRIYVNSSYTENSGFGYRLWSHTPVLAASSAGTKHNCLTLSIYSPSGALNSVSKSTKWSRQPTIYKLSATFNTYKAKDRTVNNLTAGTTNITNGYSGWFTRNNVTYKVYPLVKVAYYNRANRLSYTFIAGTKARTIPANTYYTVTVTNNNSIPTATATAIASDSRAKALQTKLRVNKPVAYSGTGVQITNNGTTTIKVKSYSLINLDADKKYQSSWGNTANANSNILSSLLSSGKLGFTTQSVTVNGATKLGVPYTMAYNAAIKTGSSIKNWAVKAKKGSYAVADSSIVSQQIKLEIEGGQIKKVIFSEGFRKSDGTKLVPSGTYTIDVGTASTSSILVNIEATAGSDVRTAFEKLGITGNASTDVLMQAFAHNEGEAVKADANGNTATGLLLNGGSNWYNEYCYCLGIKVEEITFSAKDLIATDKIPLEIGPAQPADKSKYFSNGSTFTITGTTMILGTKTLVSNYTNPQPSFIIADVPVTAA